MKLKKQRTITIEEFRDHFDKSDDEQLLVVDEAGDVVMVIGTRSDEVLPLTADEIEEEAEWERRSKEYFKDHTIDIDPQAWFK